MQDDDHTRRTALQLLGLGAIVAGGSGAALAAEPDPSGDDGTGSVDPGEMASDPNERKDRRIYAAKLRPQEAVQTRAHGVAGFQLRDGRLTFVLAAAKLEDTFMSHIHEDEPLGPIAVWLHGFETQDEDLIPGVFTGIIDAGTISDETIQTGRADEAESTTVDELVAKIDAGEAYVNVHTEEYPGGELAGRIEPLGW